MPTDRVGRVYLDYAATAPFDGRLHDAVHEASSFNASALYAEGREAALQLEEARKRIAFSLGAHAPSEIMFTSGGSESATTAIRGLAVPVRSAGQTHVVVSAIEHHAVLHAAKSLKSDGYKVDELRPNAYGVVEPEMLEELLARIEAAGDATCLVCVQWVNNELGSIHPVNELARVAHARGALFFTDAVQALGKVEISLEESGVDAAGFAAHKIGGLKGSGALYLRRDRRCKQLVYGGGQEAGRRAGTSNVLGAHVFAAAVELAVAEREANWQHAAELRSRLLEGLAHLDAAHALSPTLDEHPAQAPHILSLLADGLEGETMVMRADSCGFAVSAGSACGAFNREPSHVLTALSIPRDKAYCSLRISFGPDTTGADIDAFIDALAQILR